jgi:hypothetical protein
MKRLTIRTSSLSLQGYNCREDGSASSPCSCVLVLSGDGWISFEMNMVGRGCFRVPLVMHAGRARDRLRFAVWTGDLGFVKAGACVGL